MHQTSGAQAEEIAAVWLERQGYRVIDRNWRVPTAEIDLVALKKRSIFFVEVKYRRNVTHGNGLDYITHEKLRRMQRSAQLYLRANQFERIKCSSGVFIAAISLNGVPPRVEEFIDSIEIS